MSSLFISRKLVQSISHRTSIAQCTNYRRVFTTAVQDSNNSKPPSKVKQFMKKYGYVGIGVYLTLSAVDLTATMALINIKGAKRVKEVEHYVVGKVKGYLGMEHEPLDQAQLNEKPSFGSLFIIAYGIHKTVLLPFRLSVTAAITPMVARKLIQLGWAKKVGNKIKSQVKK